MRASATANLCLLKLRYSSCSTVKASLPNQFQHVSPDYVQYAWSNVVLPLRSAMSCSWFSLLLHMPSNHFLVTLLDCTSAAVGMGIAKIMVVHSVTNALSPLCNIPELVISTPPFCDISYHDGHRGPVESSTNWLPSQISQRHPGSFCSPSCSASAMKNSLSVHS